MTTATVFPSKFAGTCKACHRPFRRGQSIAWIRHVGTWHPPCCPFPVEERSPVDWAERVGERVGQMIARVLAARTGASPETLAALKRGIVKGSQGLVKL